MDKTNHFHLAVVALTGELLVVLSAALWLEVQYRANVVPCGGWCTGFQSHVVSRTRTCRTLGQSLEKGEWLEASTQNELPPDHRPSPC